ncbi:hypothetical protein K445DRAFT_38349, partial [Daldinia sp. EC12]
LGYNGDEVTKERFPLPNLQKDLEACVRNVHREHGACIIRGLDPRKYTKEDNIILFLGISSYIGDRRGLQNSKGEILTHITEWLLWGINDRHVLHTRNALPFHNDMGCEILSLQVQSIAETGGHTYVAPLGAICDDLQKGNSEVLEALKECEWSIRNFKESPLFQKCALIGYSGGKNVVSVDSERIGPDITPRQAEALDKLQKAACKHGVDLEAQTGDIIFINNLSLLHSRDSYEDSYMLPRHYVRLWLRNSERAWDIPSSMRMPWDAVFGEGAKKVTGRKYPTHSADNHPEIKYASGTAAFVDNGDSV